MAKHTSSASKKGSTSNLPDLKVPESLEVLVALDKISKKEKRKAEKKNKNGRPKILLEKLPIKLPSPKVQKKETPKELLQDIQEAALEDKVTSPAESIEASLPEISQDEKTPLIRDVPQKMKVIYEEKPDAQVKAAARQETKRRQYQERVERPSAQQVTPITPAGSPAEGRPVAYSTRAMYGTIEQNKGRVYSVEERSFQMANIIADKSPQPKIKEANLFDNRLMKDKQDLHDEYSLNLKDQPAPKPKRRYPWEF